MGQNWALTQEKPGLNFLYMNPLALASGLFLLAGAARADECPPCSGTSEVSLAIVSKEFVANQGLGQTMHLAAIDSTYRRASPDGLPQEMQAAADVRDFRRILQEKARLCQRVRFLYVATHGGPGYIGFDDGAESAEIVELDGQLQSKLGGLSCVFAPGAEVRFGGCSVAKSCEGENFANAAAGYMLHDHGGLFWAETLTQRSIGGLTANFDVKSLIGMQGARRLSVAAGSGAASWEEQPTEKNECRQKLQEAVNVLTGCGQLGRGSPQPGALAEARDALAAWDRMPGRFSDPATLVKYNQALSHFEPHRRCQ